jgi:L-threonylcarbamoyladenylate synthase
METQEQAIELLISGGIGILSTDTIYGIVGQALSAKAVERIYEVRKRRPEKPCIILIADIADVEKFGVILTEELRSLLSKLWPGPVSVVLPCEKAEFIYLHRGTKTLAFRLPADEKLQILLRATGPLIAPSANPEGLKPAVTIEQAKKYFGDAVDPHTTTRSDGTISQEVNFSFGVGVDFYVDAGPRGGEPSTVVAVQNGKVVILRQGAFKVPEGLA